MIQKNLTTTLFTLNEDLFPIMLPLQFVFQYLRNIFKPRSAHLSKTAMIKRNLSINLSIISVKLICPTYLTLFCLKVLSNLLLILWKVYGLNIQRLLILPNILKAGGIQITIGIWKSIGLQSTLKIRDNLGIQLRK